MALIAKEYRGELADLYHYGHIVAVDTEGKILWQLGDPNRVTYSRSSAKLMQAIPVVESGALEKYNITERELALMCASHRGENFHTEAVLAILNKAGLSETHLQCGTHYPLAPYMEDKLKAEGITPTSVHSNCSGKHAGLLIAAKALGLGIDDYYTSSHYLQQRATEVIAQICDYPADEIILGLDGCGVPVHAMPIYKFAQGYAKMSKPETLGDNLSKTISRITAAMLKNPEMVDGTEGFTTELMQTFGDRLFCKSGANAFYAIGIIDKGIGIAMKMDGGASPIVPIAMLETLVQIGVITKDEADKLPTHKPMTIKENHKGEVIGKTIPEFILERLS
ncbi:MAG: asparaginase [Defluviitaleaceae bacterium]|nr:asparaginase [Defluviitaleaceae bacterium]